ncbi:MAG: tetratricopeptide repeat protein [Lentisphaeria bacterium]
MTGRRPAFLVRAALVLWLPLAVAPAALRAQAPPPAPGATAAVAAASESLRLAEGLLARGFHDLARKELAAVLERRPPPETAARARLLLIECLRAEGKASEVLAEIERFRQEWPGHPRSGAVELVRGEQLLALGREAEAGRVLAPLASAADPNLQDGARYHLARLAEAAGRTAEAAERYAAFRGLPAPAERPYVAYAWLSEGLFLRRQGDRAGAAAAWNRLAAAAAAPAAVRAEALFRLGEMAFAQGDHRAAATADERLLREWPASAWDAEARRRLAWAHYHLRDFAGAQTQVIHWAADHPAAGVEDRLFLAALCQAGVGRVPEALAAMRQLLARPGLPASYAIPARRQVAAWLATLGRTAEAVAEAKAFLAAHPAAPERADVAYFAGEALARAGSWAEAEPWLRQALAAAGPSWTFWPAAPARLEECLRRTGRLPAAAAAYRELAQRGELAGRPGFLLRAGQLAREAGAAAAAAADFAAVRERHAGAPEAVTATVELAQLEADRGDFAAAELIVAELLERLPAAQSEQRSRLQLFAGWLAYSRKEYAVAVERFRRLVDAKPPPAVAVEAKRYLATALLDGGNDAEARTLFAELLKDEAAPPWPDPLLARVEELFFRQGRLAEAALACRRLKLAADPQMAGRGRLRLAAALFAGGDAAAARAELAPLLAEAAPPAFRKEALALAGDLDAAAGRTDQAVLAYTAALQPPSPARGEAGARARLGLASIHFREGRLELALEQAVGAFVLENDPVFTPQAMLLAVRILQRQGRTQEARTTWRELLQRFPVAAESLRDDPEIRPLAAAAAPPGA